MHRVAESMARAELAMGVDSRLLDPFAEGPAWDIALDSDIHVWHTHIPDTITGKSFAKSCRKPFKRVFVHHGTPELIFEMAVRESETNGYGSATGFSQSIYAMKVSDAVVTFTPRHHALFSTMMGKQGTVDLLPMGLDLAYWQAGVSRGKYQGRPSFSNCDNQYPFKWAVEFIKMWPWIRAELTDAFFHVSYVPVGTQRFVDVLAATYGSVYGTVIGNWHYQHDDLRNIFKSLDFYLSGVRYGDLNRVSLEAKAAGMQLISYPGNDYADYWIPEGDHRRQAQAIIEIGKGNVEPRADAEHVPTEAMMAHAAINVYERVLGRVKTNWALGEVLPDALPENIRDAIAAMAPAKVQVTVLPAEPELTVDQRAKRVESDLAILSEAANAAIAPVIAEFAPLPEGAEGDDEETQYDRRDSGEIEADLDAEASV